MEAAVGLNSIVNEQSYLPTRSPKTVLSKKFEADLTKIEAAFNTFAQELDEHALFVYGRTAQEVHIETEYPKRKIQVASLQGSLESYGKMLEQLEDDLVDIDVKFVEAKNRLQTLWAKYLLLGEKCTTVVAPLLAAQVHKDALVTCKKTIEVCEAVLKKKCSTEEQQEELEQIAVELATDCANQEGRCSNLNSVLQRNIRSLHEEATSFCKYASSLLIKKNLADISALLKKIAPIEEPAVETNLMVPLDDHPLHKDAEISTLISKFEALSLEAKLQFKPGSWFRSFRYGKIFSTVEEMESYATALQGLRSALEDRIYTVCQGILTTPESLQKEARSYKKTIAAIQKDIEAAKANLKKGEFSTQIHAGLHYAAELLAVSEEIKRLSQIFSALATNESHEVFTALVDLRALINIPDHSQALFRFIQKLQSIRLKPLRKQDPFVSKIREITRNSMEHTVKQRGLSFIALLPSEVVAKKSIWHKKKLTEIAETDDPVFLLSKLVIKQCTEFFYLHKNRGNIHFSFLLHRLTTYPEYAPVHKKNFLAGSAYKELVEKYLSCNPLDPIAKYFETFSEIFELLDDLEAISKITQFDIYTFTHTRYLLDCQLEGLPESLSELNSDAKNRFSALKDFSDTLIIAQDSLLYKNLLKAVWGKDQEATLEVERMRGSNTLLHQDPVIQTLLDAFLLQKLKANSAAPTPDDRKRLQLLLARYLQNLDLQYALGKMHSYFFIEKLLCQELQDPTSPLLSIVNKARDPNFHQKWEKVLVDYEEWKDKKNDATMLFNDVTPLSKGQSGHELFFMWICAQIMNPKLVEGSPL